MRLHDKPTNHLLGGFLVAVGKNARRRKNHEMIVICHGSKPVE